MKQLVQQSAGQQTLHVRFQGRSTEMSLASLHLDPSATDQQIKEAVAAYLEHPASILDDHVVVRSEQVIIVRPEAIYG
jgi:hypothetical protein